MKRTSFLFILILTFVIPIFTLSGCSVFKSIGIPPTVQSSGSYVSSLKQSTKKADIYNKLNTVMYIRATYFNKSFVRSYKKEYYYYYMKKTEGLTRKLRKHIILFVSIYTPRKSYNNLDSNRSIWMVYLVNNEGESVMPENIKLSNKKRVFLKRFFPYITDWSRQYIIEFPKYYDKKKNRLFLNGSVKWIKLIITGVNGKAVLKWNINN